MDPKFPCSANKQHTAESCCTCHLPLPKFCSQCLDKHLLEPGLDHIPVPLTVLPHVKSEQDLIRLQSILSQLRLTAKDMEQVENDFISAREQVEAAAKQLIKKIEDMKLAFLKQLDEAKTYYRTRVEEVLKELSANAWKGDSFTPVNSFAALFWKHLPGRQSNIRLEFKIGSNLEEMDGIFNVTWALPYPGFAKIERTRVKVCSNTDFFYMDLDGKELVKSVKARIQEKKGALSDIHYLQLSESGEMKDSAAVGDYELKTMPVIWAKQRFSCISLFDWFIFVLLALLFWCCVLGVRTPKTLI